MSVTLPETGVVQVRLVRLDLSDAAVAEFEAVLSAEERDRADRFRVAVLRRRFIAARGTLRSILGGALGLPPRDVQIEIAPGGKPFLAGRGGEGGSLDFNLSHAGDRAIYALAVGRAVGVDLEEFRPLERVEGLARRICSQGEFAAWEKASDRLRHLVSLWVAKEAVVKGSGAGIRDDLSLVEIAFDEDARPHLIRHGGSEEAAAHWGLATVPVEEGWVAMVAAEGRDWRLEAVSGDEVGG